MLTLILGALRSAGPTGRPNGLFSAGAGGARPCPPPSPFGCPSVTAAASTPSKQYVAACDAAPHRVRAVAPTRRMPWAGSTEATLLALHKHAPVPTAAGAGEAAGHSTPLKMLLPPAGCRTSSTTTTTRTAAGHAQ